MAARARRCDHAAVQVTTMRRSFDLAPMSPLVRGLTIALLLLPVGFAAAALAGAAAMWIPALLLVLLEVGVWLGARPTRFDVAPGRIEIHFPAWTRSIGDVRAARAVTVRELGEAYGLMLRVGVGGLWGGFGWLWTTRGGLVEFYVSRTDGLVLIERRSGRPLLLTPDDPAGLASAAAPHA
jgi:hypothetical protein